MKASGAIICSGVIDGTSITSANVLFALANSGTTTPADSAFTLDNFPTTLNAGYYVWQATKITDSDGKISLTGKMCLGPTTDFLSGTEVYAISTSNSTAPADNQFGTTYNKKKGYYLWTATRVQYTNGAYAYLNKKCVGYWGEDGKSITGANVFYALSTSGTTAPADSSFTYDDFPDTLNSGYYVWEATKVTFSSGNPVFTGKMCLGPTTDFLSGTEVYAISKSNSTAPAENTTNWKTTYEKTKGYYLWTATRVQYTNGDYAYLNKKCVGYWGEDGNEGKGYKLLLVRNNLYTDANWDSCATVGGSETYSKRTGDPDFTTCRVGDIFCVSGASSDSGKQHAATYKCTSVSSSSITGTCLSHTKDGGNGNDGLTPNPNILLRTTFPSFVKIKEKWNGEAIDLFNSSYTNPTPTSELIEGHNIVRMEQANSNEYDMLQDVGLEAGKWYTLSFYHRQGTYSGYTGRLKIFLSYGSTNVGGCIAEHWLDGVKQAESNDGYTLISGKGWAVTRHVIKFKTVSNMSGVNPGRIYFRFNGGDNIISMPKLEVGEDATPYIANDDDLICVPYNILSYRRYNSRSANNDGSPAGSSDVSWSETAPSPTSSYPYIWERIQAYDKDGVLQGTSYVCLTGANGQSIQGKMGRFLWYAGLMSEVGGTTFKANDYQAPYVNIGTEDDPHCYAYVGSNGNSITFPNSASNYTTSNGWEEMDTDFKYLIAKALFSEYAHLGSAIINRDWMISCHGTIGGSAYGGTVDSPDYYNNAAAYTWFDPQHPNGNLTPFSISLTQASTNKAYSVGWQRMTEDFSLMGNATYIIRVKAKVSNESYAGHVRIAFGEGTHDGTDFIYIGGTSSTIEVELSKEFSQTLPTSNDFRIYAATDNADCTITISSITIERKDNRMFIPNYAIDLKTGKSYQNAASFSSIGSSTRVEINDGIIRFFGTGGFANIELGIDTNGCAILNFYDKDGNYKYGLGPDTIIDQLDSVPNSWGAVGSGGLAEFDLSQNWSLGRERSLPNLTTKSYYKFTEGYAKLEGVRSYNIGLNGDKSKPSQYNNKCYDSKMMSSTLSNAYPIGSLLPAGYYVGKEFMLATNQQISSTEGIYSRRCYSVTSDGDVPVYLGELYYHKDSQHVNNTWLTDSEGNKLNCSTSKTFLQYIQNSNEPQLL